VSYQYSIEKFISVLQVASKGITACMLKDKSVISGLQEAQFLICLRKGRRTRLGGVNVSFTKEISSRSSNALLKYSFMLRLALRSQNWLTHLISTRCFDKLFITDSSDVLLLITSQAALFQKESTWLLKKSSDLNLIQRTRIASSSLDCLDQAV